jgi:hypothetical protein
MTRVATNEEECQEHLAHAAAFWIREHGTLDYEVEEGGKRHKRASYVGFQNEADLIFTCVWEGYDLGVEAGVPYPYGGG